MELTIEYDRIQGLDAQVLAISTDDLSGAMSIVEQLGLPFPILYDPTDEVPEDYMVFDILGDRLATPSIFIVDKEGFIRWKYIGDGKSDRPATADVLSQLVLLAP